MSFILARKIDGNICAFGDTKLTWTDGVYSTICSNNMKQSIDKYGIIKNMILNENICLCFAGNKLQYVSRLITKIKKTNANNIQDILNLALESNELDTVNGMDYIICFANELEQHIYKISNGEIQESGVAWIGSYDAFNYFQGLASEDNYVYERFENAIRNCGDPTVGCFCIGLRFDREKNQFLYIARIDSTIYNNTIVCPPNQWVKYPISQGPEKGSYTVCYYESTYSVAIYFGQGCYGVIYNLIRHQSEDIDNLDSCELWMPNVYQTDKLNFDVQLEAQGMNCPFHLYDDPFAPEILLERMKEFDSIQSIRSMYINLIIREACKRKYRDEQILEFKEMQRKIDNRP